MKPGSPQSARVVEAGLLPTASSLSVGVVAACALIAVGLFNSIMFPTIFALASEGLGEETPNGSAPLGMAIVGGAIIPLATGAVADANGLVTALFVPVLCYVWVAIYGVLVARRLGVTGWRAPVAQMLYFLNQVQDSLFVRPTPQCGPWRHDRGRIVW